MKKIATAQVRSCRLHVHHLDRKISISEILLPPVLAACKIPPAHGKPPSLTAWTVALCEL